MSPNVYNQTKGIPNDKENTQNPTSPINISVSSYEMCALQNSNKTSLATFKTTRTYSIDNIVPTSSNVINRNCDFMKLSKTCSASLNFLNGKEVKCANINNTHLHLNQLGRFHLSYLL